MDCPGPITHTRPGVCSQRENRMLKSDQQSVVSSAWENAPSDAGTLILEPVDMTEGL